MKFKHCNVFGYKLNIAADMYMVWRNYKRSGPSIACNASILDPFLVGSDWNQQYMYGTMHDKSH